MTKKLLSLTTGIFTLVCVVSKAQPVLTSAGINPVIGESFTFINSNYISPGNAGANQTWDLSSMSGTSSGLTSVVAPSSTTNAASFPGSNVACNNPTAGTVNYYKTTSNAMQNYGVVSSVVIPYSEPEDIIRFPFAFNNTYSDAWTAQFANGGYTFYRKGTTTVTADGYGTLITPTSTYTNVMRVHFVQAYQDSANVGMPYIITYNNDEYMWYKEGVHAQVALVCNLTNSLGSPFTGGAYLDDGAEINDVPDLISSPCIFPNPASNRLTLNFTLGENKEADIKLFNAFGQQVETSLNIDGIKGSNTVQLDVAKLPEGIYFVQIVSESNKITTGCFVVDR